MPDRRRFALLKQPFALDALGDVTVTSPVTGDILQYNGTVWANTTVASMTGLSEAIDDRVASLLSIGNGLTATYNDPGNTYTLSANIDGTSLTFAAGAIQRAALTGDVTASAGSNATTIANGAVTYAKIQNVSATSRFLGRITAGAGVTEELTGTQATTLLDAFTDTLKGLVPASGGGTTNFLRADGTWNAPPGGGGASNTGTGGWVLLSDQTVSGVATVDFTSLSLSSYVELELVATNVVTATDASDVWFRVGTGATPTWATGASDYSFVKRGVYGNTGAGSLFTAADTTFDAMQLPTTGVSNVAGESSHCKVSIFGIAAGEYCQMSGYGTTFKSDNNHLESTATGRYNATTEITALRVMASTGNISGRFILRGRTAGTPAPFDPNLRYDDFDDLDGTFGSLWTSATSGGTASNLTSVAGRPGIRRNDTGTGATGYALSTKANTTAAALPFIGYSDTYPVTVETEFRVPTLPDGTNTFIAIVGLVNTPTGSNSSASVGIGWDAGASQARFMCRTRSSGGTVTTTYYATTAPAANTWYRARVVVRTTDVKAYVYLSGAWTLIATMTANLPTESMNPFFTCTKSAGTTARQIDVDYVWTYFDIAGGRPA